MILQVLQVKVDDPGGVVVLQVVGLKLGEDGQVAAASVSQGPGFEGGLFLALPSAFTLVCLIFGVWAVNAQVRIEESLLQKRFGSEYEMYRARTPRWLLFR